MLFSAKQVFSLGAFVRVKVYSNIVVCWELQSNLVYESSNSLFILLFDAITEFHPSNNIR
jgi:hypothetical protein